MRKKKKTGESGRQRQEGAWGVTSEVRKESGCLEGERLVEAGWTTLG
jgi:hypothetical protein